MTLQQLIAHHNSRATFMRQLAETAGQPWRADLCRREMQFHLDAVALLEDILLNDEGQLR